MRGRWATGCVVVDEAYGEFRRAGTPSALELLPRHRNLVVTRTMSKAFALAGARLGYLAAGAGDLRRAPRRPAALPPLGGHPGRRAGGAAARRRAARPGRRAAGRARRHRRLAARRRGSTVADSDANFVLFGTFADRHAVWQGLLDRGVLIRETGPDGWLRVSIGTAGRRWRHSGTALTAGAPRQTEEHQA